MTPDLLNFKKGWMSLLDERGEWKKHWFVLTDSSLRYYRDSNAEEADDLDGEIDLSACSDVTEYQVQRNYGFQIHTKEGVFTLSAMTSGIRRNWIEALRKSVRPTTAPDVTKLSDSNKENAFRDVSSRKHSTKAEEERVMSDMLMRSNSSRTEAQNPRPVTFDYVELEPIQPVNFSQEYSQRARGPPRTSDSRLEGSQRGEAIEREQAQRIEDKRKWFESSGSGSSNTGFQQDILNEIARKGTDRALQAPALAEEQQRKMVEEIERKWLEFERLPLREHRQVQLTPLISSRTGSHSGESTELLEKELQSLKMQLERAKKDLESFRRQNERLESQLKSSREDNVPKGYVSQVACEHSLAQIQEAHQQAMLELQRHHQWELERLKEDKEQLLAEETAATLAAIESLKKAHREEVEKELQKALRLQNSGNSVNLDSIRRQHKSEVEALQRELQVLSEQYSQKCLEVNSLARDADQREKLLSQCQEDGKQLLKENQELSNRLSEEITRLQTSVTEQGSGNSTFRGNSEKRSSELEVLLRVKENELQYLKKELHCLREELQSWQKDKQFATKKYKDVYEELSNLKTRSEREIDHLREHLRLAMAALQEKQILGNSIAE